MTTTNPPAAGATRRTGFAYCPRPDAFTARAYRRACNRPVYTPEVIVYVVVGLLGAARIAAEIALTVWKGGR